MTITDATTTIVQKSIEHVPDIVATVQKGSETLSELEFTVMLIGTIIGIKWLNIKKSRKYRQKGYGYYHLLARSIVSGFLIGVAWPCSIPAFLLAGKGRKLFKP